jgi:PAS domain-containing protein
VREQPIDALSLVASQQETIAAQRRLIGVSDELDRARQQLLESTRLELRAAQMVAVLRVVLLRLVGVVTELTEEKSLARASLERAQEERERATTLADAALELITALGERAGEVEVPVEAPLITVDAVMDDLGAALGRVRQILDEHDGALDRLESQASAGAVAERLFTQYVNAPMPVAVLDSDGRFLRVNEPFDSRFHYTAEQLDRLRMTDIAKPWAHADDEHLVLPADGEIDWFRIRRWVTSGCHIAVFENDWERSMAWCYPDTMLPNRKWLEMWCANYGFGTGPVGACLVTFDLGSVTEFDDRWPDYLVPFARRVFGLLSAGVLVAQLEDDTFLLLVDGREVDLAEFLAWVPAKLEQIGEGVPFVLAATECNDSMRDLDDKMLRNVGTAANWTKVHGCAEPCIVREPSFEAMSQATSHEGPLLYQPFVEGTGYHRTFGVRVVGSLSLPVFRLALEHLEWWYRQRHHPHLDFVASAEELRRHDWRAELSDDTPGWRDVGLMLDGEPEFTDYVLLRRFGPLLRAGVVSTDDEVLRRAEELQLHSSRHVVLVGEPVDADGVVAWMKDARAVR